jgi:hypothetical protein
MDGSLCPLYSNPCYDLLQNSNVKAFGIFLLQLLGLSCPSVALLLEFFNCFSLGPQKKLGATTQTRHFFFTLHFSIMRTTFQGKKGKIMGPCLGDQKKAQ